MIYECQDKFPLSGNVPDGFKLIIRADGYAKNFGPTYLHSFDPKIGFFVMAHHLNPSGICHGGALATFADLQFSAIRSKLKGSHRFRPTLMLALDYFAPIQHSAWVEAEVTILNEAHGIVTTRALITVNGQLVAQSRATYHVGIETS